jgi:hypothetical protein
VLLIALLVNFMQSNEEVVPWIYQLNGWVLISPFDTVFVFYDDNESENNFFLSSVIFEWLMNLHYFGFVLQQEGSGNYLVLCSIGFCTPLLIYWRLKQLHISTSSCNLNVDSCFSVTNLNYSVNLLYLIHFFSLIATNRSSINFSFCNCVLLHVICMES